jgi:predicted TIM-barrel fold metal-dependent hydrolase
MPAEAAINMRAVAAEPALTTGEALNPRELQALAEAAAWYAKYHERMISAAAADPSARAVAQRDRFETLHAALRKLGVRIRRPDGL